MPHHLSQFTGDVFRSCSTEGAQKVQDVESCVIGLPSIITWYHRKLQDGWDGFTVFLWPYQLDYLFLACSKTYPRPFSLSMWSRCFENTLRPNFSSIKLTQNTCFHSINYDFQIFFTAHAMLDTSKKWLLNKKIKTNFLIVSTTTSRTPLIFCSYSKYKYVSTAHWIRILTILEHWVKNILSDSSNYPRFASLPLSESYNYPTIFYQIQCFVSTQGKYTFGNR